MLDDSDLFWNHVELLADLDTDLDQSVAIVRADALGLGQVVTHHLAGQIGVKGLAAALLTRVRGDLRAGHILLCGLHAGR